MNNNFVRIVALALAGIMVLGIFVGVFNILG